MVRHHTAIVIVTIALALTSVFLGNRIEMVTDAKQMLPQSNPRVESFNRISEDFSSTSLIITVEAPTRAHIEEALPWIARAIERDERFTPYVRAVRYRTEDEFIRKWGLMLQKPDDLRKTGHQIESTGVVSFLTAFNDNLEDTYSGDEGEDELDSAREELEVAVFLSQVERFTESLHSALTDSGADPEEEGRRSARMLLYGDPFSIDRTGTMGRVEVAPTFPVEDISATMALTALVQELWIEAESLFPAVTFGYAGDVALNADEQDALSSDLFIPTLIALAAIIALFVFSFDRIRTVLFAATSLVVGILVTVGLIAVSIHQISLISSIFAVLLVGLGIDFGVHLISGYDERLRVGDSSAAAIEFTLVKVGSAIIVGGLTTVAAFLTLTLTDSGAIREFGVVAAMGIVVTMVTMLVFLPALLLQFPSHRDGVRRLPVVQFSFMPAFASLAVRRRWITLGATAVVTAVLAFAIPSLQFEYDMTKFGPQDGIALATQYRIQDRFRLSPFPVMVSKGSLKQAYEITEALKEQPYISSVSSITEIYPLEEDQAQRLVLVRSMAEAWTPSGDRALSVTDVEILAAEIQRLEWNVVEIGDMAVAALGDGNMVQRQRNEMVREVLGAHVGKPGREVFQHLIAQLERYAENMENGLVRAGGSAPQDEHLLDKFQHGFSSYLNTEIASLLSIDRLMTLDDVPSSYRDQLVSADGTHFLVMANPEARAVAENQDLFRTRERLEELEPDLTGSLQIAVEFSDTIRREVTAATVYVIGAIALLLILMFRRISFVLAAFGSLAVAVMVTFGLFSVMGIDLNAVTMLILPLIFGLGIAYFVHVIHRSRVEKSIDAGVTGSGKGVALSAFTTMIGFGSLGLIGKYRAIQMLGSMLFIGVGVALLAAITLLPAVLSFFPLERSRGSGRSRSKNVRSAPNNN